MTHDPLARRRSEKALTVIEAYASRPSKERSRYAAYVKATPAMIRRQGLGQTLAVLLSRSGKQKENNKRTDEEKAYGALYDHLQAWLCGDAPSAPFRGDARKLMTCVATADQKNYVAAQSEAGLYLEWLKKFANAFLQDKDKDKDEGKGKGKDEGATS